MSKLFITERVVSIILEERKKKGITQKQIAKFMGVCTRTYQRMEEGNLTLEELAMISSYLDMVILVLPKSMMP